MELAVSKRSRRRFSPAIFTDDLQEALRDLNTAMKSPLAREKQPDQEHESKGDDDGRHDNKKLDMSAAERRKILLKKQPSKIVVTSLEFSEALPLAAFASLLVEAVVKLDPAIKEVEVLGKGARYYKEFQSSCSNSNSQSSRSSSCHDQNENNNNNNNTIRMPCEKPIVNFPE